MYMDDAEEVAAVREVRSAQPFGTAHSGTPTSGIGRDEPCR